MFIFCLIFAYRSLNLRSSYIVPISNVKGRGKRKKFGQQKYNKNFICTNLDKTFTLQLENIGLLYFFGKV